MSGFYLSFGEKSLKTFQAPFVEKGLDVIHRQWAFLECREDLFVAEASFCLFCFVAPGDMDGQGWIEFLSDLVKSGVAERFDRVGRRAVDGADIDTVGAERRQDTVESFDLFLAGVDAFDHQDFENHFAVIDFPEISDTFDNRLKIDRFDGTVQFFETLGRDAVEREFDCVESGERLLDFRTVNR